MIPRILRCNWKKADSSRCGVGTSIVIVICITKPRKRNGDSDDTVQIKRCGGTE